MLEGLIAYRLEFVKFFIIVESSTGPFHTREAVYSVQTSMESGREELS